MCCSVVFLLQVENTYEVPGTPLKISVKMKSDDTRYRIFCQKEVRVRTVTVNGISVSPLGFVEHSTADLRSIRYTGGKSDGTPSAVLN